MSRLPPAQRGVALIVALLVLAIAVGLAASMIRTNQQAIERTERLLNQQRADQVLAGALQHAGQVLNADSPAIDGPEDAWAVRRQNLPFGAARVSVDFADLQGRFNLNTLVNAEGQPDPLAVARFRRLLNQLGLDAGLSDVVIDWIDPDQNPRPRGAEDGHYQRSDPPYRTADRPLRTVTALRAVKGMDPRTYATLAPYVSALPASAGINVNTADPVVMAAITGLRASMFGSRGGDGVWRSAARPVWPSLEQFQADPMLEKAGEVDDDGLTVNSGYFLCHIVIELDGMRRERYVVFERGGGAQTPPRIIAMSDLPCLTGFSCI